MAYTISIHIPLDRTQVDGCSLTTTEAVNALLGKRKMKWHLLNTDIVSAISCQRRNRLWQHANGHKVSENSEEDYGHRWLLDERCCQRLSKGLFLHWIQRQHFLGICKHTGIRGGQHQASPPEANPNTILAGNRPSDLQRFSIFSQPRDSQWDNQI